MSPFRSKRYFREFSLAMGFYVVAIIIRGAVDLEAMPKPLSLTLLFAPVLATILVTIAILRAVFTMDEVQRRVITEACLVSMVIVGMGSFGYALVAEDLCLVEIDLIWVWPALIGVAGIAQCINTLRLR
ncbi:hypothetical protein [Parvularcula lutaonensis]|uniref:Uncharacterized protein n=1 Tax=Parvularcula lutaonensis TaxID=491923 RepID=A0ABV7M9Q4_9PROT|nr:hypothetical protein [Parvularcula lutaonensis]GGY47342.1 hypothetical protein GCM10007148_15840 [Parvularcula lutaonensis]